MGEEASTWYLLFSAFSQSYGQRTVPPKVSNLPHLCFSADELLPFNTDFYFLGEWYAHRIILGIFASPIESLPVGVLGLLLIHG